MSLGRHTGDGFTCTMNGNKICMLDNDNVIMNLYGNLKMWLWASSQTRSSLPVWNLITGHKSCTQSRSRETIKCFLLEVAKQIVNVPLIASWPF